MTPEKILAFFGSRFELKKSTKSWYYFNCPFCDAGRDKKKCRVNPILEVVKCWECGYGKKVVTFLADSIPTDYQSAFKLLSDFKPLQAVLLESTNTKTIKSNLELPKGYKPIKMDLDSSIGNRARNYLATRMDLDKAEKLGFGYVDSMDSEWFGKIIIPFKEKGKLVYFIGRSFIGGDRYKNPNADTLGVGKDTILYNSDALDKYNRVFVTEGVFDAITFEDFGIATLGWSISDDQLDRFIKSSCKSIVLVPDVGFFRESLKLASKLIEHKKVYVLPTEKLSHLGKDANDVGLEPLLELYQETRPLTFGSLIQLLNSYTT